MPIVSTHGKAPSDTPVTTDKARTDRQLDGPSVQVPEIPNDLELQIAMDELATNGSSEALKIMLAKQAGVDPRTVLLRSTPWNVDSASGGQLSFIGKLDSLEDAGRETSELLGSEPQTKSVNIDLIAEVERCEPYGYQPLDSSKQEIRLLKLNETEALGHYNHLTTRTFSVNDAPSYHCLSYVWGDPDRFIPLNCDGKYIMVTQNLYHGISLSFSRYPEIYLWADGLCINQDDLEERAQQVRLMGRIYSGCSRVLAIPGHHKYQHVAQNEVTVDDESSVPSSPSTPTPDEEILLEVVSAPTAQHLDMTTVRPAISLMNLLTRAWTTRVDDGAISAGKWEMYGIPDPKLEEGRSIWSNTFSFWEEDWLWRKWVLPECVLSHKVIIFYGEYVVSLDALMEFWDAAHRHMPPKALRHGHMADVFNRILHTTPATTISTLRSRRSGRQSGGGEETQNLTTVPAHAEGRQVATDLLTLLALSRNNFVTDPRDKIYAMLGLATDDVARSIPQSYHESNTTMKTFSDAARSFIADGRGYELLEHAGVHHKIPGLPSWVPDWTHQSRSKLKTHLYQCTTSSGPSISLSKSDPNKVTVRGAAPKRIIAVGPAWRYYSSGDDELDIHSQPFMPMKTKSDDIMKLPPFSDEDARCFILQMATNLADAAKCKDVYGEDLNQAIARTLCADISWSGERLSDSPAALEAFQKAFHAFQTFYAQGPEPDQLPLEPGSKLRVHNSGIFDWILECSEEEADRFMCELWPFAMALQEAQRGRRFAILKNGSLATVPWDAEVDDLVMLIEGARVPFVVKAQDKAHKQDDPMSFELIGDCYVHGLMDGARAQQGSFKWRDVTLR
ncbi:hypothetical protein PMZ80_001225 [Knufia obscura]|uniref:Heterokaryon incompatibility domain-containing protein n=1 Tax=Knufia obscura TaxID=1635080 RepID=A0ABR0S403_9EURO|nr:hypothetical protein PMZ80_001225 [Knufia obscura]